MAILKDNTIIEGSSLKFNNASKAIAIGDGTIASGGGATALGSSATASGSESIALGSSATASGVYATALGDSATANSGYATALGDSATASGVYATALGKSATASGSESIALGKSATASGVNSIAIGKDVNASTPDSIVIGRESNSLSGIVIGQNINSDAGNNILIGNGISTTPGYSNIICISLGTNDPANITTQFPGDNTILIGRASTTTGLSSNAVILGTGVQFATSNGVPNAVLIGACIESNNPANAIAIGYSAETSFNSIAIGTGSKVVLTNTTSTSNGGIAIGSGSEVQADKSIAIGSGAIVSSTGARGIQLGNGTLSVSGTFQVWNHQLLNGSTGDIPFARANSNWMTTNTTQTVSGNKTFSNIPKISATIGSYDNSTNIPTTQWVTNRISNSYKYLYVHYIRVTVKNYGELKGGFLVFSIVSSDGVRATSMSSLRNLIGGGMSSSFYVPCSGYVTTTNGNDIPVCGVYFGGSSGSAGWMTIQIFYTNSSFKDGSYNFVNDGSWENQFSVNYYQVMTVSL